MTGQPYGLKVFASIALVMMTCVGLVSCGDAGSRPTVSDGGDQMTIQPRPTLPQHPDLAVGLPSVDDASLETGASFTLSATVSNDGDGEAPAATLRYYRSIDATLTTSDTSMGTGAVGALAVAGISSKSISLTAPASPGTYYYGACVDAASGESNTTNNCSTAVLVTVTE